MNDPQKKRSDAEAEFAKALQQRHERLIGSDPQPASPADSPAPSGDESRFESAVRVLELLEEINPKRNSPQQQISTQIDEVTDEKVETDRSGPARARVEAAIPDLKRLGRFQIKGQIGRGGYGIVIRAEDPRLGRDVAIKIPRFESAMSRDARVRFEREARAAAALNHPGIVGVHEIGSDQGIDFIVCELVEGNDLAIWLARGHHCSHQEAAQLVARLADAIEHAHQRGVLHRDLKPSNILMAGSSEDENAGTAGPSVSEMTPRISDFGLAAITDQQDYTQSGAVVGTPAYMSPEQATGNKHAIGPATDVYGLGAILYQLLTGQSPFAGLAILETIRAISESEPTAPRTMDPTIPKDLEAICLKCLEKDPSRRYHSAVALQADLQNFLDHRPVIARPITGADRMRRWARRNPVVASLGVALFLALSVGLIVAVSLWRSAESHRMAAETNKDKFQSRSEQLETLVNQMFNRVQQMPELAVNGMEPVREEMLTDVNAYYTSLVSEAPSDVGLKQKQTDALLRLASIKMSLADYEGAIDIASQIADSIPANATAEGAQNRIDALMLMARNHLLAGDPDKQTEFFDQAINAAKSAYVATTEPSVADQIEFAKSLSEAADICGTRGDRTAALEFANESIAVWESLDIGIFDDTALRAYCRSSAVAAKSYIQTENRTEARLHCQKTIDLIENVLNEQTRMTPEIQYLLADSYYVLGATFRTDMDQAMPIFADALEIATTLAMAHPLVPRYQRLVAAINLQRGLTPYVAYLIARDRKAVEHLLDQSLEIYLVNIEQVDDLISRFPGDSQLFEPILTNSVTMVGLIYGFQKDFENQLVALGQSLELARRHEARIDSPQSRLTVLGIQSNIAEAYSLMERYEEAIEEYERTKRGLQEMLLDDPENGEAARFLCTLGENLALAYSNIAQYGKALEAYRDAMRVSREEDLESMMGIEAIYLSKVGQLEEAEAKFKLFVDYQVKLSKPGSEIKAGVPASEQQINNALPQLVQSAAKLLDAGDGNDQSTDAAWENLRQLATEAAIDGLRLMEEDQTIDDAAIDQLLEQDKLQALKQTTAFQEWSQQRGR